MDYWKLLRPKQWVKNVFIFAPLIYSRNFFNPSLLGLAFAAFIFFSLLSSGVYVFNDICDRERDRSHPLKCRRPVASGRVSVRVAFAYAAFLCLLSLLGSFVIRPALGMVAFCYFFLVVFYSLYLKKQVIIDVMSIAAGFILRVVAGAVAVDVEVSPWLLICTGFLALFLALGKRRHELHLLEVTASEHRPSLENYSFAFIDQMVAVAASGTILSYSLYTFLAPTSQGLMVTIPFVVYALLRYLHIVYHQNLGGEPEEILLHDRPFQVAVVLWLVTSLLVLYFGSIPGVPVFAAIFSFCPGA
ncbi:MAG: Prenyltransferase UbiA [Thermoanaerobacterales bacterium 50_218]|nr:MAG: Prenyltransferase UbiA [Thermoanaerobacterales bacterium 50_218]HAA90631.1 decaprenyl-phosphate phosphoribosyltransferase [Peptococcaceae bacterium]